MLPHVDRPAECEPAQLPFAITPITSRSEIERAAMIFERLFDRRRTGRNFTPQPLRVVE